jgi:hypothetical protein
MFFPLFSGLAPRVRAAFTAAPEEIPHNIPSLVASSFATDMASADEI